MFFKSVTPKIKIPKELKPDQDFELAIQILSQRAFPLHFTKEQGRRLARRLRVYSQRLGA